MTYGDTIAGILDEHDRRVPRWADLLGDIMEEVARLECGLVDMKLECVRLESAGMWPAVPTESWEGRNGRDLVYLRLLFPSGTNGQKRYRRYIGSKAEAIADARRKTANRQRWEKLEGEIGKLEWALSNVEAALNRQRLAVSMRPLPDLGTVAAPTLDSSVPKVEVEHVE